ncbi:MAG TPA: CPBP family intramembrane glutamic endopeptidase [Candidatus Binatia bacterium]|nr:CPBP family intramembrane glutamic endopeptidase [Candidatus Binatia bacterium]
MASNPSRPIVAASSPLARLRRWLASAPPYPASEGDRAAVDLLGLRLPVRATVATLAVVTIVALDWNRVFIPQPILDLGRAPEAMRYQAVVRLVLDGLVPLAVVVLVFRDRPERYGLRLGDWRFGLPAALAGVGVMTPIVVAIAGLPGFQAYYRPMVAPPADVLVTNLVELPAAEFLFRGFSLFALLRAIGPLGVVVATIPFAFGHLGKPELELLSTFFGGLAYGWLAWRTGSIVWGALAHVAILTLLVLAVGSTPGG